jgi:hypothetical protein
MIGEEECVYIDGLQMANTMEIYCVATPGCVCLIHSALMLQLDGV